MTFRYLLAKLNLRAFRYCVLVTFLICNALNASIACWNLGLVRQLRFHEPSLLSIDSYLAFLGASGLVILFIVALVEITRITWFIGTVWFEFAWVSLWGLMYLAAAIALTVITSQEDCLNVVRVPECASIQVLLAFTWFSAMILLIYFSTFMFAIFINKKKDATIWYSLMRKFPWAGTCTILASAPPTPTLPRFQQNTVPIIHAPKPKHARPNAGAKRPTVFSWRSGLSQEYQIEHYHPQTGAQPDSSRSPELSQIGLPSAAAAPVISAPFLPPIGTETADNNFASSLYPMYMQPTIHYVNSEPRRPEPTLLARASVGAAYHTARTPVHAALPPSPPPLGNWPRPDVMSRPVDKGKRKAPPIVDDLEGTSTAAHVAGRRERDIRQSTAPSSFSPMRPTGPRKKSGSFDSNRPPALDLPKIEYA